MTKFKQKNLWLRWLGIIAVIFSLPFLIYLPWRLLSSILFWFYPNGFSSTDAIGGLMPVITLLDIPVFITSTVLSSSALLIALFYSVSLISVITGLFLIIKKERKKIFRSKLFYVLITCLIAIINISTLMNYKTVREPKNGAVMQIVEKPQVFRSIQKSLKDGAELPDDRYEIIGWLDSNTLIYRRLNSEKSLSFVRAFYLDSGSSSDYKGSLNHIRKNICDYNVCLKNYVNTPYIVADEWKDVYISPDNSSYAFRASHIYGPEDLLIIRLQE